MSELLGVVLAILILVALWFVYQKYLKKDIEDEIKQRNKVAEQQTENDINSDIIDKNKELEAETTKKPRRPKKLSEMNTEKK